jgi:hypothetical protein
MRGYREIQRFNQLFIWLFLIGLSLLPLLQLLYLKFFVDPNASVNLNGFLIYFAVTGTLMFLFWYMRLTTIISDSAFQIEYKPFVKKIILADEIDRIEYIKYNPWLTGYGIRFTVHGKLYNVKGSKAVKLYLKDGSNILIGTQQKRVMIKHLETKFCKQHNINFTNLVEQ